MPAYTRVPQGKTAKIKGSGTLEVNGEEFEYAVLNTGKLAYKRMFFSSERELADYIKEEAPVEAKAPEGKKDNAQPKFPNDAAYMKEWKKLHPNSKRSLVDKG